MAIKYISTWKSPLFQTIICVSADLCKDYQQTKYRGWTDSTILWKCWQVPNDFSDCSKTLYKSI